MEAGDSEEDGLISVGALGCCTLRRPPGCVHGLHSDAGREQKQQDIMDGRRDDNQSSPR